MAGCDLVVPLTEREVVEATILRARTSANPDGTFTRSDLPFPGEAVSFVVELESGERYTPTLDDTGTLRFPRAPGTPYRIVATVDGRIFQFEHATRELEVFLPALGRLDRTPVTAGTTLELPPTNGIGMLMSSGLWARAALTAADMAMDPVRFDWSRAASYSGPLALLDSARGDRLYYLVFQQVSQPSHYRIEQQLVIDDIAMTNGGTTTHGPLAPAVRDRCARILAARARDTQRLVAATGGIEPVDQWSIEASVDPTFPHGLQLLAFAIDSDVPASDVDVTVAYGNPFPHTTAYAQSATSLNTVIQHPFATTALRRRAQIIASNLPLPATADCGAATIDLGTNIAIPTDFAVAATPISSDLQAITIDRAMDVEVTWAIEGDEVDYYGVVLFAVQRNAMNETSLRLQREILTTDRSIHLDSDVFARGEPYVVQVTAIVGSPRARDGVLRPDPTGRYTIAQTMSKPFVVR